MWFVGNDVGPGFRNVRYELETSAIFSLPVTVGQSDLLLDFWNWPGVLETFVYRKTRVGSFSWRLGSSKCLAARDRRRSTDRLQIVRQLTENDGSTSQSSSNRTVAVVVSQLKGCLLSDRTVRYEDSLSLSANIRYPLVLEDRLSLELWPLPSGVERDLILLEHDTSDNNLGINFEHRLSVYVTVCDVCRTVRRCHDTTSFVAEQRQRQRRRSRCSRCTALSDDTVAIVRLSLRSSLNEYHEAAYWFELECEEDDPMAKTSTFEQRSCSRRRNRHRALTAAFRAVGLPMLARHWPDGLMRERIPYTPCKTFLRTHQSPMRMISGSSSLTHGRLFETLVNRLGEIELVKLKYDGDRTYGWYSMGEFWVDAARVSSIDRDTRNALCGLYVYQVESERDDQATVHRGNVRRHVINEISFVLDHKAIVTMNGGGALARQVDVSEYSGSVEQRDANTAYVLSSSPSFWPSLVSTVRAGSAKFAGIDDAMYHFFLCCYECEISYVDSVDENGGNGDYRVDIAESIAESIAETRSDREHIVARVCEFARSRFAHYRITVSRLMRDLLTWFDIEGGTTEQQEQRRDAPSVSVAAKILSSWEQGRIDRTTMPSSVEPMERALIPVTVDFSLRVLQRMYETVTSTESPTNNVDDRNDNAHRGQLVISRVYEVPRDSIDLLRAYRDHTVATAFPLDGLLAVLRDSVPTCYEKLKLHQTIDVFVTRSFDALCSLEGPFATYAQTVTFDNNNLDESTSPRSSVSRWLLSFNRDDGVAAISIALVEGLTIPRRDSGQIAELEYRDNLSERVALLRFVRWRPDKDSADPRAKIANIVFNREAKRFRDFRK